MTVNYIEAPHHETQDGAWPAIFLAGGITGCTDWQAEAVALLENADIDTVVFNPRRVFFDVTDTTAEVRQVAWEANALLLATVVLFWFDPAGMQPIAHQELGAALERRSKSTRLNSSHVKISYAVFCLKKKKRARLAQGPYD